LATSHQLWVRKYREIRGSQWLKAKKNKFIF